MEVPILNGEQIFLRRLTEDDATQEYANWMNDPDINQYLESKYYTHTIESTKDFLRSVTNDRNYQFGIFDKETSKHIGNIKLGGINVHDKSADIGFLIGEKSYWGRGIASEAIKLVTDFAFNTLNLHKVWGGAYAPNIGSMKAFLKNGFAREGVRVKQHYFNGQFIDGYLYGKINENWKP